jgi:hypothetical protein
MSSGHDMSDRVVDHDARRFGAAADMTATITDE